MSASNKSVLISGALAFASFSGLLKPLSLSPPNISASGSLLGPQLAEQTYINKEEVYTTQPLSNFGFRMSPPRPFVLNNLMNLESTSTRKHSLW